MLQLRLWGLSALCLLSAGALAAGQNSQPASNQKTPDKEDLSEVERFTDGHPDHGAKLFKRYCAGCHGEDGRGGADTFMPHVQNLTVKDYIEFLPDGFLFTVITEGGAAVGKSGMMPAWRKALSDQDVKDVIAFIRTLPTY
jgi:mono/diheme cytochrome c family protein